MTKEQTLQFTKLVCNYTMGGGGQNGLLDLLVEGVVRVQNPQGVEKVTHIASAFERIATLANNAAALARDPDFIAAAMDAIKSPDHNGKFPEERFFDLSQIANEVKPL